METTKNSGLRTPKPSNNMRSGCLSTFRACRSAWTSATVPTPSKAGAPNPAATVEQAWCSLYAAVSLF